MFSDETLIACGVLAGMGFMLAVDTIQDIWWRWRYRRRAPPARGQIHLFQADGDHFLSAKLSVPALQKLLDDYSSGRLR